MYKVVIDFADLHDKQHIYRAGDSFPRSGYEVSDERLKELSSSANRLGKPLISKVDSKESSDKTLESLNPAIPAQPEMVGQETPSKEEVVDELTISEKPKKSRKKK